eukprot:7188725-Pyramimonas_sp.AAC.1
MLYAYLCSKTKVLAAAVPRYSGPLTQHAHTSRSFSIGLYDQICIDPAFATFREHTSIWSNMYWSVPEPPHARM